MESTSKNEDNEYDPAAADEFLAGFDLEALMALEEADRLLTDALCAGDLPTFIQHFNAYLASRAGVQIPTIVWMETHATSDDFKDQNDISVWMLTNAFSAFTILSSRWRFILVSHLLEHSDFVPTPEWFETLGQFEDERAIEHFLNPLFQHGRLDVPDTASLFVRNEHLLDRLGSNPLLRMTLLQRAFERCTLPRQWIQLAHRIGLTDADIGELITLRCNAIIRRNTPTRQRPFDKHDKQFLDELLLPAEANTIGYRDVFTTAQLITAVMVVRKYHPGRGNEQVEGAIRTLCFSTNGKRNRLPLRSPRQPRLPRHE